jgi:hypothetical protein
MSSALELSLFVRYLRASPVMPMSLHRILARFGQSALQRAANPEIPMRVKFMQRVSRKGNLQLKRERAVDRSIEHFTIDNCLRNLIL